MININLNHNWEFSTDQTEVALNEFDFVSVIMHELAHAFGFLSFIPEDGDNPFEIWSTFDDFVVTRNNVELINDGTFALNRAAWTANSTGGTSPDAGLFFNGPNARAANGGELVGLYTPTTFDPGSSVSHIDTDNSEYIGLMMLHSSSGPGARTLSTIEEGIFMDLGFDMVATKGSVGGSFNVNGLELRLDEDGTLTAFVNNRFDGLGTDEFEDITFTYEAIDAANDRDTATVTVRVQEGTVITNQVYISEYVEGTSNNKAIEIFNGTGSAIDLADFELERYSNGSTTPASVNLAAATGQATLAAGGVLVLYNGAASAELITAAGSATLSAASGLINHNGNDAYALRQEGVIIDMFGIIGEDPGTAWTEGTRSTQDQTLRRTVGVGNATGFSVADTSALENEWSTFAVDSFDNLGGIGPEIEVSGNGVNIVDGDTTPDAADGTNLGTVGVGSPAIVNTFTVTNSGTSTLNLSEGTLSGAGAGQFAVGALSSTSLAVGESATFTVTYNPAAAVGTHTATVSLVNNDTDENPFNFDVFGETTPPAPEIDVLGSGLSIADGDVTPSTADGTDFGDGFFGFPGIVRTFTVSNLGTADLNLTNPVVSGAGAGQFAVSSLGSTVLAPGASTTFTVTYNAAAANGTHDATITLGNDDSDENPYNFNVTGTTATPQVNAVLNETFDSDAGFSKNQIFFTDGDNDYFGIFDANNRWSSTSHDADGHPAVRPPDHFGATGRYLAGEDLDAADDENSNGIPGEIRSGTRVLTWSGVNIAGLSNVSISAGLSANRGSWDVGDRITFAASIDGGAFVDVINFEHDQRNVLSDGTTVLDRLFQTVTGQVPGTGSSLTLRLTVTADGANEEFAIDNVLVTGVTAATVPANPVVPPPPSAGSGSGTGSGAAGNGTGSEDSGGGIDGSDPYSGSDPDVVTVDDLDPDTEIVPHTEVDPETEYDPDAEVWSGPEIDPGPETWPEEFNPDPEPTLVPTLEIGPEPEAKIELEAVAEIKAEVLMESAAMKASISRHWILRSLGS